MCLPPRDSQRYAAFVSGVEKKRAWLGKRLRELGSAAQVAYSKRQPVAFVEYVSATNAPVPAVEGEKTALITCIYKPKFQGKGVGTTLVQAALNRLRQLDVKHVKTLVAGARATGKRVRRHIQRHLREWQSAFSRYSDAGENRGRDTQGDRSDKTARLALMT